MPDDLNSDLGYSVATQWVNQTIIRLSLSMDRPYTPKSRSQRIIVRGLGSGMTLGKSNFFYPK